MYEHYLTVEVDEARQVVETYRVDGEGQKVILTQYAIAKVEEAGFDAFAKQLGEDLIFFSVKLSQIVKP